MHMHHKGKFIAFAITLFFMAAILLLYARVEYTGICAHRDWGCLDTLDAIVVTLTSLLFVASPLVLILAFLRQEVFSIWFKFARIYLPIALVLVAITPSSSGGSIFIGFGEPDKESVAWLLGAIFVIIGLILIIRAHRRLKRQAKTPPSVVGG